MDTKRFTIRSEHTRSSIVVAGIITVALIFAVIGFALSLNITQRVGEPYDGGRLIDATGPIVYEEDAEVEELGRRLVALASGVEFTEEQIEQLVELVAGLFWEVSFNSWLVEELDLRVQRLEDK